MSVGSVTSSSSSDRKSDAESRYQAYVEKATESNNDQGQNGERNGIETHDFAPVSRVERPKRSGSWDRNQNPIQAPLANPDLGKFQAVTPSQVHHANSARLSVRSGSRGTSPSRSQTVVFETDPGTPNPFLEGRPLKEWVLQHHQTNVVKELDGERLENPILDLIVRWILPAGVARLFLSSKLLDQKWSKSGRLFRISFAELQRLHMRKLQVQVIKHAVHISKFGTEPRGWEEDLATYIQAAKDHDYMLDYSKKPRDVFVATGEREVDRLVTASIIDAEPHHLLDLDKEKAPAKESWEPEGKMRPIPDTRPNILRRTGIQDFAHRIVLAIIGGALLVGPMWLMVLHNSLYTGLVTTTVCVGIFGLFTSLALDKPLDVLSSTAAYAAVLVVFVGFQNSGNSS
ncbi:hypothetical protein N0V93_001617 [Gnomoniopsis smithogilvyi]|uniref:DUF6594 domain-containing protein n=1 Tax=Gnomoniopsis smithogilvyi TaxID=1191159 RepID=A0A9W8Z1Y9_9PEZI|nr:hypothetical protein N0V93_001617 [Gnomoniopsis smithogilvyi]